MKLRQMNKRAKTFDENDNLVINLDKYWPYGLDNIKDPENPDLLFVHSQEFSGSLHCRYCDGDDNGLTCPIELVPVMRYCSAKKTKMVLYSEHEKEYKEFVESHEEKAQKFISVHQILRPKCCDKDCKAIATISVKDIKFSNLYRYFYQNHTIVVYLKLDPESEAMIPIELDESFASTLKKSYLKAFGIFGKKLNLKFSDTVGIPRAKVSRGFKLKLREYQLRSINWMKSIEAVDNSDENVIKHNVSAWIKESPNLKIKLGHTGYYIGFKDKAIITASPDTEKIPPFRLYGGILADDTGSGKTITTLGLIYSNPFTKEKEAERIKRFTDLENFNQSRASLIICPENIQLQWIEEAKRCDPKFKILSYIKMDEIKNFRLKEILEADLIVTSYQFLLELSRRKSSEKKEIIDLEKVHFYRCILDEFHELTPTRIEIYLSLKYLRSDHIWGLTGTPNMNSLPLVLRYFKVPISFETVLTGNIFAHEEFLRKFIKRNEPDLNLPPIENQIIWVKMKSSEKVLHDWKSEKASCHTKLMMCSHYQLADKRKEDAFMTLEQVKNIMTKSKEDEVTRYQNNLNAMLLSLNVDDDDVVDDVESKKVLTPSQMEIFKLKIESIQKYLDDAQRRLNYCLNVFKVIQDPEGNECRICYDTIDENSLSLLPCSHIFCYDCVTSAIDHSRKYECPLCRQDLPRRKDDIFKIIPEKADRKGLPGILALIDTSKYSSKMISLCKYLIELIESENEAKIILFLQYKDLGNFISEIFTNELKLKHVRVAGTVDQRQAAIKTFRESNDVRVIMLSSEDSVSGINLTEATHVILLHPFFTGQGEESDLAYEKQGISRAYRFGLDHPLKVVRFAVKDTIEEEITLRRMNMKL